MEEGAQTCSSTSGMLRLSKHAQHICVKGEGWLAGSLGLFILKDIENSGSNHHLGMCCTL